MAHERITLLDMPFDTGVTIADILALLKDKSRGRFISFVNPSAWALARANVAYRGFLEKMDLVLPDGQGVVLACRLLTEKESTRISFDMSSLAGPFFSTLQESGGSLMVVGGQPGVDESVMDKIGIKYPGLVLKGSAHGYGDMGPKVALVMEKNPDAVVVGMGAVRQEEFLLHLKEAGYKGMALTCGGFLDQYLLADDYYPDWIDRYNLRFAYRLYKEPQRLWQRYLLDYPYFIGRTAETLVRKGLRFLDKPSV